MVPRLVESQFLLTMSPNTTPWNQNTEHSHVRLKHGHAQYAHCWPIQLLELTLTSRSLRHLRSPLPVSISFDLVWNMHAWYLPILLFRHYSERGWMESKHPRPIVNDNSKIGWPMMLFHCSIYESYKADRDHHPNCTVQSRNYPNQSRAKITSNYSHNRQGLVSLKEDF